MLLHKHGDIFDETVVSDETAISAIGTMVKTVPCAVETAIALSRRIKFLPG
jgi:hypothetical protein